MKLYSLGFIFRRNHPDTPPRSVFLIEKKHPHWQAGLLNGIGGKVEKGESLYAAMRREAVEECGYDTEDWIHVGDMEFADALVGLFYTIWQASWTLPTTRTDERVVMTPLESVIPGSRQFIYNVPMLIGACMSHMHRPDLKIKINFSEDDEK